MKKEGLNKIVLIFTIFFSLFTSCNKDEVLEYFFDKTTDKLTFSWEGEEKGFAFTTNGDSWTASTGEADWITLDITSGNGTGKRQPILVNVAPNMGGEREGKIRIQVGDQINEVTVYQEDGRLILGEATMNINLFNIGEEIKDTYITIPYEKGFINDEVSFSIEVKGTGSAGINQVIDFKTVLTAKTGEIKIPITGNATTKGSVTFTISTLDTERGLKMPSPITKDVFDPNEPHPNALPFVISGFIIDPQGNDDNHEYIQFLALRDITFDNNLNAYSVIVCNNAGTTTAPTGSDLDRRQDFPPQGWASGSYTLNGGTINRTYKINITSGSVRKGEYFYVGGNGAKINGPISTDISGANWVVKRDIVNTNGDDGIGNKSTGIFANSGVTSGLAVFKGTAVDHDTEPMDVIFIGPSTGALYGIRTYAPFMGQTRGYRITNTDHYTVTGDADKYFKQGNNSWTVAYPGSSAVQGRFYELSGVYNVTSATWTTPRSFNLTVLSATSTLSTIETPNSTKMVPTP